jgi:hypothetical protein
MYSFCCRILTAFAGAGRAGRVRIHFAQVPNGMQGLFPARGEVTCLAD